MCATLILATLLQKKVRLSRRCRCWQMLSADVLPQQSLRQMCCLVIQPLEGAVVSCAVDGSSQLLVLERTTSFKNLKPTKHMESPHHISETFATVCGIQICVGLYKNIWVNCVITLPPIGGTGYCFCAISFFLSFFVSLSATLWENGWTDMHEIFREGVEWPWDDLIIFWVNSGKWVGGSKVNLFVITGHSSEDWR